MSSLFEELQRDSPIVAAELRPPRTTLGTKAGMDAWIDTYHAVRRLTRRGGWVFLTDSAVGSQEEDNLRHLVANLGGDAPRDHVVPFLTAKHSLEYCLAYADRAALHGFPAMVVLGGDRSVGAPRCVDHAWQLREAIRARQPTLKLGGWANPHADPVRQVDYLLDPRYNADFYLTQVVSHYQLSAVENFLAALDSAGVKLPGMFGVFYYRSANRTTLQELSEFLPVPAAELAAEFERGATAERVCLSTIEALIKLGIRQIYISNLPLSRAAAMSERFSAVLKATSG